MFLAYESIGRRGFIGKDMDAAKLKFMHQIAVWTHEIFPSFLLSLHRCKMKIFWIFDTSYEQIVKLMVLMLKVFLYLLYWMSIFSPILQIFTSIRADWDVENFLNESQFCEPAKIVAILIMSSQEILVW